MQRDRWNQDDFERSFRSGGSRPSQSEGHERRAGADQYAIPHLPKTHQSYDGRQYSNGKAPAHSRPSNARSGARQSRRTEFMPIEQRQEHLPTFDSGSDESWYVFGGGAQPSKGYSPENLEEQRSRSGKGPSKSPMGHVESDISNQHGHKNYAMHAKDPQFHSSRADKYERWDEIEESDGPSDDEFEYPEDDGGFRHVTNPQFHQPYSLPRQVNGRTSKGASAMGPFDDASRKPRRSRTEKRHGDGRKAGISTQENKMSPSFTHGSLTQTPSFMAGKSSSEHRNSGYGYEHPNPPPPLESHKYQPEPRIVNGPGSAGNGVLNDPTTLAYLQSPQRRRLPDQLLTFSPGAESAGGYVGDYVEKPARQYGMYASSSVNGPWVKPQRGSGRQNGGVDDSTTLAYLQTPRKLRSPDQPSTFAPGAESGTGIPSSVEQERARRHGVYVPPPADGPRFQPRRGADRVNGGGDVSGTGGGGRRGEGKGRGGKKGNDGINGEDPDSGGVSKYGELPSISAPGPIVTGPDGRVGFWAISIQGQPMFIPTPTVS